MEWPRNRGSAVKPFHNGHFQQVLKVLAVVNALEFVEGRKPLHNYQSVALIYVADAGAPPVPGHPMRGLRRSSPPAAPIRLSDRDRMPTV